MKQSDSASRFVRLLTGFDGNVTNLLEQIVGAPIQVVDVRQHDIPLPAKSVLYDHGNRTALRRDAVLMSQTGLRLATARSHLALARLPPEVQGALRCGTQPIGRILTRHRLEVFREVVRCRLLAPTPGDADPPSHSDDDPVVERVSQVWRDERPVMEITELFTRICLGLL
ncbi:chorismate pyruvate-lyase family protein [Streptomyces sp. NL15-2K]|uniref:chorismate--pyruvate lyase family protein n=1 Tax=Streptomyces sp. NL15-2K TaxID=376149 RepID=UPI00155B2323|nr:MULTISPECIES: chorismate pyruvate-lyase family protein [Actinomycetes]WKX11331.1 chorismate pyruvate-lyase family protein [Kutzneria buriramensis]